MLPINLLKTWLEIVHMNSQTYDEAREVVMDKILTYFHSQRHAELYVYQYENQSEWWNKTLKFAPKLIRAISR